MSKYFKRIAVDLPDIVVSEGEREIIRYGRDTSDGFQGIKYNDCGPVITGLAPILDRIPIQHHAKFIPLYMTINRDVIPHIDSGVNTVINIYLKAGGYMTDFNKPKEGRKPFKMENQTNGECYHFDDVDLIDRFVAANGHVYVMDVTKLHSVHSGTGTREALALSTLLPFDQVCGFFEEKDDDWDNWTDGDLG